MNSRSISALAAIAGSVLAGSALGLAAPALADAISGSYSGTATASGGATMTASFVFTPCGEDCLRIEVVGADNPVHQLHRQGSTWNGEPESGCSWIVSADATAADWSCPMIQIHYGLTKTS